MNYLELNESGATKGTGQRRRAKLIAGDAWGSSAYYPGDVLERDAYEVFVPGTRMYENHFTESEASARPEGDVSRMVGKLTSYGEYEPDNPEGPGVYADVEFYDSYVPRINEIAGDVGLSISGTGDYVEEERDGRFGKVITKLLRINSVDVVTEAGAGGKIVSIIESKRPMAGRPILKEEGEQHVAELTKDEFNAGMALLAESIAGKFTEAISALSTDLKESLKPVAPEATEVVTEIEESVEVEVDHGAVIAAISEANLPAVTAASIVADLKEGKTLDEAVASQVSLKESFVETDAQKTVRIIEAERQSDLTISDRILATMGK